MEVRAAGSFGNGGVGSTAIAGADEIAAVSVVVVVTSTLPSTLTWTSRAGFLRRLERRLGGRDEGEVDSATIVRTLGCSLFFGDFSSTTTARTGTFRGSLVLRGRLVTATGSLEWSLVLSGVLTITTTGGIAVVAEPEDGSVTFLSVDLVAGADFAKGVRSFAATGPSDEREGTPAPPTLTLPAT